MITRSRCAVVALLLVATVAGARITCAQQPARQHAAELHPRAALATPLPLQPPPTLHTLVLKFRDGIAARATDDGLVSLAGRDLTSVQDLLEHHGATIQPLLHLPAQTLAAIEQRAARRSRRAQPDLASLMRITVDDAQRLALADALRRLDTIEFVQLTALQTPPPCNDIAPATPSYASQQTYLTRNPGMHLDCAQFIGGATGVGITIADVEYGLNVSHEDLCNVMLEPGQTIHPSVFTNGWDQHGTAVAGMLVALDNNYGCTGIAPDANFRFFSEWTIEQDLRRETAIASAIATLAPGDILLLEMQAAGPGGVLLPAEYDLPVWMLTRTAVDAGIVVIAAAGNGGQNLDGAAYQGYLARGDSGAILVGSGSPDTDHARFTTSNYGSRVNVQGWGGSVFTLGFGDFAMLGNNPDQAYTDNFAGTSSAAAMVAGAAAVVQSMSLFHFNELLTPSDMRDLLIDTGRPQGGNTTRHIGPFPYLSRAAIAIGIDLDDCGGNGNPNICRITLYGADDVNSNGVPDNCDANGDLDGNGVVNIFDLLILITQWGDCAPGCQTACSADLLAPDCVVDSLDLVELLGRWSP